MRAEDLKRFLLRTFGSTEFYGYEAHKELTSRNVKIAISRLYRILTEMLEEGLLQARWEKSQLGPRRRVYRLGEKGRKEQERLRSEAIEAVHAFYNEYIMSLPPEVSPFDSLSRLLCSNLKGQGNIAYVTPRYSMVNERVLYAVHRQAPEVKIYLIKPNSQAVDLNLENLQLLDGSYDDIPLKEGYVDLLVVAGVLKKDSLEARLVEWHRVLRPDGTLAITTPTAVIQKYRDPMTIGDFVERYEFETLRGGEYADKAPLTGFLKEFFGKVDERQVVHVTVFLASQPRPSPLPRERA